jgi:hypothetical protein
LLGKWKTKIKDGELKEIWSDRKNMLFGNAFLRQNDRITFREKIALMYINDTLNYIVTFEKRYDSTYFKATTINDSLLIFENPKNDFPKIIKYQRLEEDKIKATISGDNNQSETFNFYRE